MSAGRQIVCGHCGQINRLPAERTPAAARCGSRHKPIFDGHPIEIDEQGFSRHVARSDIPVLVDAGRRGAVPDGADVRASDKGA
jgi:thioredoxin 2